MKTRLQTRPTNVLVGLILLLLALVLTILASASCGFIKIAFQDVARIIVGAANTDPIFKSVVLDVRLPRILTACIVGAGLSVAGATFQGILLNPLADPYTLGISAGAALGASVALVFDFSFLGVYSIPLCAFLGAILTLLLVIALASSKTNAYAAFAVSSNNLILAGVIVTAIFSAAISFVKYLADEEVAVIIFWLMGSFASRSWSDVLLSLVIVSTGTLLVFFFASDLNIISLGDKTAKSLGVDADRVRIFLLIVASLMAAICVSISGIIGFVGLIIPHLVRFLFGPDNRILVPASAFLGGTLLVFADTITRTYLPTEVPIGVLTALIGGPVFCVIFLRRKREWGERL